MTRSDALRDIASRLPRLTPCWQDPERFHEAKSDLVAELRRLADTEPPPRRALVPVERVVERVVYVSRPRPSRGQRSRSPSASLPLFPEAAP